MFGDAQGLENIERMFRRLFAPFPDLGAEPLRSAVFHDTVFIESECVGTLGRRSFRFSVCDRFVIEDGKIVESSIAGPSPIPLRRSSPFCATPQVGIA